MPSDKLLKRNSDRTSAKEESDSLSETGYTSQDLALCSTHEARLLLSMDDALRFHALPLACLKGKGGKTLHLVTSKRGEEVRRELQFVCGCSVELSNAPLQILEDAILRAYLGSEEALARKARALEKSPAARPRSASSAHILEAVQGDAAQFLTSLLHHAAVKGASDLHLCPTDERAITKMRLDGTCWYKKKRRTQSKFMSRWWQD